MVQWQEVGPGSTHTRVRGCGVGKLQIGVVALGAMARIVLPLGPEQAELEHLSWATGLSVETLLDLRRRGYKVEEGDDLDQW